MSAFLELLRVAAILIVLAFGGGMILTSVYSSDSGTEPYSWLGGIAVVLLIFVLYRNKLQFSGWHKSESRDKLPRIHFIEADPHFTRPVQGNLSAALRPG